MAQPGYERLPRDDIELTVRSATDASSKDSSVTASSDDTSSAPASADWHIVVFHGTDQLTIPCTPDWTVGQVAATAFPQAIAEGKNVRCIYQGTIMSHSATLRSYGIVASHSFMHVLISDPPPPPPPTAGGDGAVVGAAGVPGGADPFLLQDGGIAAEQWAGPPPDSRGTNFHFFLGFLFGVFFGIFAVLWLILRRLPQKQKIGTVLGMAVNAIFTVMRSSDNNAGGAGGAGGDTGSTGSGGPLQ